MQNYRISYPEMLSTDLGIPLCYDKQSSIKSPKESVTRSSSTIAVTDELSNSFLQCIPSANLARLHLSTPSTQSENGLWQNNSANGNRLPVRSLDKSIILHGTPPKLTVNSQLGGNFFTWFYLLSIIGTVCLWCLLIVCLLYNVI